MKTTSSLTGHAIVLLFPFALAVAGLTGCAAAADGSPSYEDGTTASGSADDTSNGDSPRDPSIPSVDTGASAASHIVVLDDQGSTSPNGGAVHEGATTPGKKHNEQ